MARLFEKMLVAEDFEVEVTNTYEVFSDVEKLKQFDLIVPCITMDKIEDGWVENVAEAVAGSNYRGNADDLFQPPAGIRIHRLDLHDRRRLGDVQL